MGSDQGSLASIVSLGTASKASYLPDASSGRDAVRGHLPELLAGNRRQQEALKIVMDQGLVALAGLCQWTQFATFVNMLGGESPEDQQENELLQGLPPLSSSSSEASALASALRDHARYGLRGDRIVKASTPRDLGDFRWLQRHGSGGVMVCGATEL